MHRDLKPANIFMNANCDTVIGDLGLIREFKSSESLSPIVDDTHMDEDMTTYVVTRWYRAPELFATNEKYDKSVDIWSMGCIHVEMIKRSPFLPGKDDVHPDILDHVTVRLQDTHRG